MPRVDFGLFDRECFLKLMCTTQLTYSSFVTLLYLYLFTLQSWTSSETGRSDVMKCKWSVVVASVLHFGNGIILAMASNTSGIRGARGIVAWIILETFLVPTSVFLLVQLHNKLKDSKQYFSTDLHYARINVAQVVFLLCQYFFIAYALDFLVHSRRKTNVYDPSIRPENVDAPTDPQITTTESRHIRLAESFFSWPKIKDVGPSTSEYKDDEMMVWKKNEEN